MRAGVAIGLAIALAGCGTARLESLEKHNAELIQQLTELRKIQTGQTVTMDDLQTRLFLLQDDIETVRRALAGRPIRTVKISPQPKPAPMDPAPSGEFDCLSPAGDKIACGGAQSKPRKAPVAAPPAARKAKPLSAKARTAVKLYKDSYAHVKAHRYEQAIDGFKAFIDKYPKHGYADNAVYWMGECYYDRALWVKAMQTFSQVINTYPMGNKAPDAMLKMGLCYEALRNLVQAREVLTQVTEIYPNSPVSRIALKRLERLQ